MILDSSPGNLIREPALRPSQTQYSCRGKTKEQIILDSSGSGVFLDSLTNRDGGLLLTLHILQPIKRERLKLKTCPH